MQSEKKNRWGQIAAVVVVLLLISSAVLEWMAYGRTASGDGNPAATPQVGAISLDQTPLPATLAEAAGTPEAGSAPNQSNNDPNAAVPAPAVTITSILVKPGDMALANAAIRLQSAPNPTALTLSEYPAGATFTIAEPSGDYNQYPVVLDGQSWCRVRASDGLVGWLPVDLLEITPQTQ